MGGYLPYVVLAAWIPFTALAFALMRANQAAVLVLLGGMLFLPEVAYFDAPLVPPLGKHEIAASCAFLGLLVRSPRRLHLPRLGRGADVFLVVAGLSGSISVLLNRDTVSYGPTVLPGMGARDVLSFGIRDALDVFLPYLVGRMCIQSTRDVRALFRMVLGLGLVYSLLIMFELRFSPNLHRWIYGYHARPDFSQTIRWGGFRPTVFMEHGLAVALFAMVVALVAAVQVRLHKRYLGLPSWSWALYFALIMVLCRSTGAILLGAIVLAAIVWTSPRKQLRLAVVIATICLLYPCLRLTGLFPTDQIVGITSSAISPDRAASIKVRFDNEELLIAHVQKRLWFGWASNGRNRLYDADGNNAVITDGHWIILLSTGGVVLLYGLFGLMLTPVFAAMRVFRRVADGGERQLLAGLTLVAVCYVFDLLPNGMFNQAPLFYAGALTSFVAGLRLGAGRREPAALPTATVVMVSPTGPRAPGLEPRSERRAHAGSADGEPPLDAR